MGTPTIDLLSHEDANTSDDTPTMIALCMPSPGWHGQVEAVIHAYDPNDDSVCAAFVVRGIAKRVDGVATVHKTGIFDFQSSPALSGITAELSAGTYGGDSHVLLVATGHATIPLEWHIRTTTMFEAV